MMHGQTKINVISSFIYAAASLSEHISR